MSYCDVRWINFVLNINLVDFKMVEKGRIGKSKIDWIDNIYKIFVLEFLDLGLNRKFFGGCDFLLIDDCEWVVIVDYFMR